MRIFLIAVSVLLATLSAQGPPRRPRPATATLQQPELKQEDYGLVSGQVTSAADGTPIRKATVTLRRSDNSRRDPPQTASTGDGGVFLFQKVAPGRYKLYLERNGYVSQELGARRARSAGQEVRVENGQRVTGLNAKLTPHGVVTGAVRDEDGEPMANVRVQIFRWGHVQGRRQLLPMSADMTDDRGHYRIYGVAPGKYVIAATSTRSYRGEGAVAPPAPESAGGDEAYPPVYYPTSLDAAQASNMEVTQGASLEGIDFTMRRVPTVRVRGRVLRAAAGENRQRGTTVTLLAKGAAMMGGMSAPRAMADAQGQFELRGVRPGSYTLHAEERDRQTRLTADLAVEVGASGVDNLAVPLSPGVELTGSLAVEGSSGEEPRISVWIRPRQGAGNPLSGNLNGRVNADGTFAVPAASPGEYEVSVSGLPEGYYLKSVRAGDQETLHTGFAVAAGGGPVLRIIASPDAGTVEGSVVNHEQKAVLGSTVVLWPVATGARAALYKSATTDAQGHFAITSIAPGEYRLAAFEFLETGAAQDPEFLKAFEGQAEKLVIKEKSRETRALKEVVEP